MRRAKEIAVERETGTPKNYPQRRRTRLEESLLYLESMTENRRHGIEGERGRLEPRSGDIRRLIEVQLSRFVCKFQPCS